MDKILKLTILGILMCFLATIISGCGKDNMEGKWVSRKNTLVGTQYNIMEIKKNSGKEYAITYSSLVYKKDGSVEEKIIHNFIAQKRDSENVLYIPQLHDATIVYNQNINAIQFTAPLNGIEEFNPIKDDKMYNEIKEEYKNLADEAKHQWDSLHKEK